MFVIYLSYLRQPMHKLNMLSQCSKLLLERIVFFGNGRQYLPVDIFQKGMIKLIPKIFKNNNNYMYT